MPKKIEEKKKKSGRVGVPPVREAYQEMQGIGKVEDEAEKREQRIEEKAHEHQEHEKVKGYEGHLPPIENRINSERPPFKKR